MLVDARDRFISRFAQVMLDATKKDGPFKAAARTMSLPVATRLEIRGKMMELKRS